MFSFMYTSICSVPSFVYLYNYLYVYLYLANETDFYSDEMSDRKTRFTTVSQQIATPNHGLQLCTTSLWFLNSCVPICILHMSLIILCRWLLSTILYPINLYIWESLECNLSIRVSLGIANLNKSSAVPGADQGFIFEYGCGLQHLHNVHVVI